MPYQFTAAYQSPAPVFNPMPFVVESPNNVNANYKYICDIYISGVTGFTRLLINADPIAGVGAFLVNEVLRSRVTSDFETGTGTTVNPFMECENGFVKYELKFGEQYGASGSIVNYTDILVTGTLYGFNGSLDSQDWLNYLGFTYTMLNSSRKFLHKDKIYSKLPIRITDQSWLYYYADTTNRDAFLKVVTYDGASVTPLQTITLTNQFANKTTYNFFQRASVGPVDLNLVDISLIASGTQPFITSSVAYYTVCLTNAIGTQTSELVTYYIDSTCTNSEEFPVHFKNNYGGFDTYSFYKKSKRIAEISRKTYQKNVGGLNTTTKDWTYLSTDAGEVTMDTQISDKYLLNSDWITDNTAKWLKQLFTSPEVYLYDPMLAIYVRVNVKASAYESKKVDNQKMFNLTLELEASQQSYRQQQ
jgi:hypothetical protein